MYRVNKSGDLPEIDRVIEVRRLNEHLVRHDSHPEFLWSIPLRTRVGLRQGCSDQPIRLEWPRVRIISEPRYDLIYQSPLGDGRCTVPSESGAWAKTVEGVCNADDIAPAFGDLKSINRISSLRAAERQELFPRYESGSGLLTADDSESESTRKHFAKCTHRTPLD